MKANEVATKNHVSFNDILEICRELGISCQSENDDVPEKDVFLIEKKLETLKKKRLEEAEKAKKKKKIKIKGGKVSDDLAKRMGKGSSGRDSADQHSEVKAETEVPDSAKRSDETKAEKPSSDVAPEIKTHESPQRDSQQQQRKDRQQNQRPNYNKQQGDKKGSQDRGKQQGGRPQGQHQQRDGKDKDRPQGKFQSGKGSQDKERGKFHGNKPQGQHQQRDGKDKDRPQGKFQPRNDTKGRPSPSIKDEKPISLELDDQVVKKSKGIEKEKDKEKEKEKAFLRLNKKEKEEIEKNIVIKKKSNNEQKRVSIPEKISITENITVGELAKKLNIKASEVIAKLMNLGVMATINQSIDADTAAILAAEYNTEVDVVSLYDETVIKTEEEDRPEDYVTRPPVVAVMGHVDHGKTKLLDSIRKTNVIDSEFGGITQHIGAYTVEVNGKKITFLDTPGHAAFTTMRARGAKITDIVILVVAANDGVMPQTVEAISHAKAANVPIIVAINKIDLPEANIDRVKQELTAYDLIPEEWGGSTLFAEISAKQGINIDLLLELVLIQAEMLELKANPKLLAKGTVIESKLDPGRGAVSTVLVQNGTLHIGDFFVVGVYHGKVRAMFDDKGKAIEEATPSTPVEILGVSGVCAAGDPFECVESDKTAKQISQKRLEYKRIESAKKVRKVTLESLNEMIKEGEVQELNVIVKADVDGSTQALTEALEKLSTDEVRVRVIHSGTGGINDSDVMLASASNAIIIGYHVRPTGKVAELAERERVSIKFYNIIFEATDDIKAAIEGLLSPVIEQKVIGTGEIRQIFKISKVGTIAGSVCLTGKVTRKSKIRIIRNGVVVYDGALASLKRFKDDVSVVEAGQEFGFSAEGFNDIKEGDAFEAYEIIEIAKKL
ncbi:MAG: Translation initiation factor IF-2 [Spirochaetes bacterium ADurb.Bin218]|jgi:translation initiation factor IF-2|nr:MAG: Translation initiation factor IF-2 [Spirochaetes bacterium ADurb.Bin218]